jgi:DNA modification methylase
MPKMKYCRNDCLKWLRQQPDDFVDSVFGSPPYPEKGERYEGKSQKWKTDAWIDWMLEVTSECVRVSRGYVLFVVNGAVRKGQYLPACEGLIWKAHERGIVCERPVIWHKNAPPNRRDWFGNDWEYVLGFKPADSKPYFDWEPVAEPPKYTSGGHFRQRDAKGQRKRGGDYPKNKLARPRDVLRVTVGGGHLGHELAHENEAPFPLKLAEHFVLTCCPNGGKVLDPFLGSGTTMHACLLHDRNCIGVDHRRSQIDLAKQRVRSVRDELKSTPGKTPQTFEKDGDHHVKSST